MLKEKYQDLLNLGEKLKVEGGDWKEENGNILLKGTVRYQMEKDMLWDKIKGYPNWENEVKADIRTSNAEIYGVHVVQAGDTLSRISKKYLDNPNRYMDIFNVNKDVLKNPDSIRVGQELKIPNR